MTEPTDDDKDWTWVLDTRCEDCGFVATAFDRDELGPKIRANAAEWRAVLASGDRIATRPPITTPEGPQWSALEYGCHVRDVYQVFQGRIEAMLKAKPKKGARFKNWNPNDAARSGDYPNQDPNAVAYNLALHAGKVADIFDRVSGDDWDKIGHRSDGSTFTVESIGRYLLHDPVHHLWDVERGFAAM